MSPGKAPPPARAPIGRWGHTVVEVKEKGNGGERQGLFCRVTGTESKGKYVRTMGWGKTIV